MNELTAVDLEARKRLRAVNNQIAALAREVKRIAVSLQLDEEALDRIIDNLPPLDTAAKAEDE